MANVGGPHWRYLIDRARHATSELRDAAREGRIIEFRQRDELVHAIHRALDAVEASPVASAPARHYTPAEQTTLILADLKQADFDRFHAARISYSGSTGPRDTGDATGPYIATFAFNFVAALTALEWTHPDVRLDGQSLIVTRASIAPTWFCQQCAETFTDTRVAAAHSRHTYHVITSNPDRPSTPGGLADARSKDA